MGQGGGRGRDGRGKRKDELPCVIRVLRVNGTIRKCEQEVIRRAKVLCGKIKGVDLAAEGGIGVGGVVNVGGDEGDVLDGEDDVAMGDESDGDDDAG